MPEPARNNTFADLKEKEREARQQVIIDAAERVFASKPFNKVSMRDIAREAGISPASIYRYFPDQQALFVEAFLVGAQNLIRLIRRHRHETPDTSVENVAHVVIDFLTENDHYFKMMTHFMLDGEIGDDLLERLNSIERSLLAEFDQFFETVNPNAETRLYSHAFFAALNGVLITFRDYPGRSEEDVRRHMYKIGGIIAGLFRKGLVT